MDILKKPCSELDRVRGLPRKELQALAKELGVKANGKTATIVEDVIEILRSQASASAKEPVSDALPEGPTANAAANQQAGTEMQPTSIAASDAAAQQDRPIQDAANPSPKFAEQLTFPQAHASPTTQASHPSEYDVTHQARSREPVAEAAHEGPAQDDGTMQEATQAAGISLAQPALHERHDATEAVTSEPAGMMNASAQSCVLQPAASAELERPAQTNAEQSTALSIGEDPASGLQGAQPVLVSANPAFQPATASESVEISKLLGTQQPPPEQTVIPDPIKDATSMQGVHEPQDMCHSRDAEAHTNAATVSAAAQLQPSTACEANAGAFEVDPPLTDVHASQATLPADGPSALTSDAIRCSTSPAFAHITAATTEPAISHPAASEGPAGIFAEGCALSGMAMTQGLEGQSAAGAPGMQGAVPTSADGAQPDELSKAVLKTDAALQALADDVEDGDAAPATLQSAQKAFVKGRESGIWQGAKQMQLQNLESEWNTYKTGAKRGLELPDLADVQQRSVALAESGFMTADSPNIRASTRSAMHLPPTAGSKRKADDEEPDRADKPAAKRATPAKRAAWNSPCRPMRTTVPRVPSASALQPRDNVDASLTPSGRRILHAKRTLSLKDGAAAERPSDGGASSQAPARKAAASKPPSHIDRAKKAAEVFKERRAAALAKSRD